MPNQPPSIRGPRHYRASNSHRSRRTARLGFESLEPRQMLAVTAVDDEFSRSPAGGNLLLDVLDNDNWAGPVEFVSVTQGSLGGIVNFRSDLPGLPVLGYAPLYHVNATETFTYTIRDSTGSIGTATVTVHLTNDFLLGGLHPGGGYGSGVTVPGELNSTVVGFHDPDPNVTHTAIVRWADGVVFQAPVIESSNANGTDGWVSFWRTFTTHGSYDATWTLRSSDGTERTFTHNAGVMTVVLRPDRADPTKTALVIGGFDNLNDPILFQPDVGGQKMVAPYVVQTVTGEPSARLFYHGSNMGAFIADNLVVYGQGGNDLIQVHQAITFNARLFGQAGNDTLVGGAGHDILLGGIGNDILYGFGGRDLVFGGLGQDFVQGAGFSGAVAGEDSDIVIGSYVSFDNDLLQLSNLSDRWRSSDPYGTRVADGQSNAPRLRTNETVFDDWSLDYVFGSGDLDWFFVELTRDNFDAQPGETVN